MPNATKTFTNVKVEPKERIFRKTIEIIERPFTTEKKHKTIINLNRKGSIVKEKCKQLTQIALSLYPGRVISHKDLTFLVSKHIGGDRGTVRAYIGYLGRVIGSSYGNTKWVGRPRKGYLELFGFMTHKAMKWIIHAQTTLPPAPPLSHNNEGLIENYSKENFSLSHSLGYYVKEERLSDCKMPTESETEELKGVANERLNNNNNNNNTEREKFYSKDLWKNRKCNR